MWAGASAFLVYRASLEITESILLKPTVFHCLLLKEDTNPLTNLLSNDVENEQGWKS